MLKKLLEWWDNIWFDIHIEEACWSVAGKIAEDIQVTHDSYIRSVFHELKEKVKKENIVRYKGGFIIYFLQHGRYTTIKSIIYSTKTHQGIYTTQAGSSLYV